ncbi:hypothetical protein ACJX0J_030992, partial [Zea mays]
CSTMLHTPLTTSLKNKKETLSTVNSFIYIAQDSELFSEVEQKILKFEKEKEADEKRITDQEYALSNQVRMSATTLLCNGRFFMQRLQNKKESHIVCLIFVTGDGDASVWTTCCL